MTRFVCCCATQIIIIGSNVLNLYLATNGGADPAGVVRQLVPPSAGTTTHAHVLRRVLICWCEAVLSHSRCGLYWQCCTTLSTSPHQMSMIGTGTAGSRPSLWLCTSHSKCGTTHGVYLVCQPRLILPLHARLCCPSTDFVGRTPFSPLPCCRSNAAKLRQYHGIDAQLVPVGWTPTLSRSPPLDEVDKDIDVLFFGT